MTKADIAMQAIADTDEAQGFYLYWSRENTAREGEALEMLTRSDANARWATLDAVLRLDYIYEARRTA